MIKSGQKFTMLTAIKSIKLKNDSHPFWLFLCDCGKKKNIRLYGVLKGITKSCGCSKGKFITESKITHNLSGTLFYETYHNMLRRCYKITNKQYSDYGGRGIKVCERWKNAFTNYMDDMYKSYLDHVNNFGLKNTSIERRDNNKDYSLENCKWATKKEQQNNTRKNIKIEYKNEISSLDILAKQYNLKYMTLYTRIFIYNWNLSEALTTPTRKHKKYDITKVDTIKQLS